MFSLMSPNSEEQKPLEEFFAAKGLKTKNEMIDDVSPHLPKPPNESALIITP